MLKPFQVLPIGARNFNGVCVGFGRPRMWERKDIPLNAYVVELIYFKASCCNLYNSRLDAFDFGGSYVIMQI